MAQTGFTPIQLYRTTTASAVPVAGNLAAGELAINLTDKKLYAKDASNNVFLLADASSGGTTATNLAGGAAGSLPYQTGANATTFRAIGTAGQVLQVNSGATAPEWVNSSGTGDVARTTSPSFTTPSLGAATATSINGLTLTSSTGALTVANGKTLTANSTLTLAGVDGKTLTVNSSLTLTGTDATTMTFPTTSATLARTDAGQTFTGTNVFSSAPQVSTLTNTRVVYAGASGVLQDNANLTFDGTSLTMGGNPTLSAGTVNGVLFLNGSKVVSSGSALTFDGTNLGVGTSSPAYALDVVSANLGIVRIKGGTGTNQGGSFFVQYAGSTSTLGAFGDRARFFGGTPDQLVSVASDVPLTFDVGGSEQMRLDSTGLGIGTSSPAQRLHVNTSAAPIALFDSTEADGGYLTFSRSGTPKGYIGSPYHLILPPGSNDDFVVRAVNNLIFATGAAERMRLDSSGNLGLGVTPSAWTSQWKSLDINNGGMSLGGTAETAHVSANAYNDGAWKYKITSIYRVSYYKQFDGVHSWYTAASGTTNNPISFTQAMTLDASGNLVVGDTSGTARLEVKAAGVMGRFKTGAATDGRVEWAYNTTDVGYIGVDTSTEFSVIARSGNVLKLGAGNTERARIPSAGGMVVGTAAIATTATDGFLYVPTCAGTPTGTPTTQTGTAPIVVDTTNHKLYFYSGGTWRDAGP